jgi:hypothetical protein
MSRFQEGLNKNLHAILLLTSDCSGILSSYLYYGIICEETHKNTNIAFISPDMDNGESTNFIS